MRSVRRRYRLPEDQPLVVGWGDDGWLDGPGFAGDSGAAQRYGQIAMRCSRPIRLPRAVAVAVLSVGVLSAGVGLCGCVDLSTDGESDIVDFAATTTTVDAYALYEQRVRDAGSEPLGRGEIEDRVAELCLPDPTQRLDIGDDDRVLMETFCPDQLYGR